MEPLKPTDASESLSPALHAAIVETVQGLLAEQSTPLQGHELDEHAITGVRRELSAGEHGDAVDVAWYDEQERDHMAALLGEELGLELDDPVGHVEFSRNAGETMNFSGAAYIEAGGQIKAFIECATPIAAEDVLSEEGEQCYDFAASLGFGDIWVHHMFRGETRQSYALSLNDMQARDLLTYLQGPQH